MAEAGKDGKLWVCSREWRGAAKVSTFHVEDIKPKAKGDWGYTKESLKSLPISTYHMRRFVADMKYVGAKYTVREVSNIS